MILILLYMTKSPKDDNTKFYLWVDYFIISFQLSRNQNSVSVKALCQKVQIKMIFIILVSTSYIIILDTYNLVIKYYFEIIKWYMFKQDRYFRNKW